MRNKKNFYLGDIIISFDYIDQFKKLTTHEAKECQVIFSGICSACQSTTNKEIAC